MQIPVHLCVKGKTIVGTFHIPQNRVKGSPVLLMCYGFNGNKVEQHRMSVFAGNEAEKKGLCLLRFDYRGQGVSEGDFSDVVLSDRMEDIKEISNFIHGCLQDEDYSLIPIGFSDGAKLVASVVNELDNVAAICMWSPIFYQNKSFFNGKTTLRLHRKPNSNKFVYSVYGLWVNSNYLRDMNNYSSYETFCQANYPKLCVFGTEDHLVSSTIEKIKNSKINNKINIIYIEGANHVYSRTEWANKVINETMNWVIENFKNDDA